MICGLLGIICTDGVYCPLNPSDLHERLALLLEHIQGRFVLVHGKTCRQFPIATAVQELIRLYVVCSPWLVIGDMSTTGRSKTIVHTHKSLSTSILAYVQWDLDLYSSHHHVLLVAASSWNLHVAEIILPLVIGGTLVLLRTAGHWNMGYFSQTLIKQQVTTLTIGSEINGALTNYLEMSQRFKTFKSVRNLCMTGDTIKLQQLVSLTNVLSLFNIQICTHYGMSECNKALAYQLLDINDTMFSVGYPLLGVRSLLIDEQGLIINNTGNPSDIEQIRTGESVLCNCYLNDSDCTANMFAIIENQVYLKTGDLGRYNTRSELVRVGWIHFQGWVWVWV